MRVAFCSELLILFLASRGFLPPTSRGWSSFSLGVLTGSVKNGRLFPFLCSQPARHPASEVKLNPPAFMRTCRWAVLELYNVALCVFKRSSERAETLLPSSSYLLKNRCFFLLLLLPATISYCFVLHGLNYIYRRCSTMMCILLQKNRDRSKRFCSMSALWVYRVRKTPTPQFIVSLQMFSFCAPTPSLHKKSNGVGEMYAYFDKSPFSGRDREMGPTGVINL